MDNEEKNAKKLNPLVKLNNIGTTTVDTMVKKVNNSKVLLGLDFVI